MTVVKETGTIIEDANSYATSLEADAYHENMGNTAWDGFSDELKDAGLIRGTLMLESRFRGRWIGYKTNNDDGDPKLPQLLAWPRRKVREITTPENFGPPDGTSTLVVLKDADYIDIGVNEIPLVVHQACMEAAFMHASGSALIPDTVTRDKYVTKKKVDIIEQTFSAETPAVDRFPLIDQLLQSVAIAGGVNLSAAIGLTQAELDAIEGKNPVRRWVDSLADGA